MFFPGISNFHAAVVPRLSQPHSFHFGVMFWNKWCTMWLVESSVENILKDARERLFSLSSWFLMSFFAAVISDRCCSLTVDACFIGLLQVCSAFSDESSVICSYPQYFFFLLLIFLIELVAGVLAYVYYQRVSAHYSTPELNYCFPLEQWSLGWTVNHS